MKSARESQEPPSHPGGNGSAGEREIREGRDPALERADGRPGRTVVDGHPCPTAKPLKGRVRGREPEERVGNAESNAAATKGLSCHGVRVFEIVAPDLPALAVALLDDARGEDHAVRGGPRSTEPPTDDGSEALPPAPCREENARTGHRLDHRPFERFGGIRSPTA